MNIYHLTQAQLKYALLDQELAKYFPAFGEQCIYDEDYDTGTKYYCPKLSMYNGYIDFGYAKYSPHLKRHLQYCQKNPDCKCYWPEYSQEAAQISDCAYLLFRDLIINTALSELLKDYEEQLMFISTNSEFFDLHGLTIAFIAKQLNFIDYYNVCRDIENYSSYKFTEEDALIIKYKLEDILEILYLKFFALYNSCYKKHPNSEVDQDIRFMKLLVNDVSGLEETDVFSKSTLNQPQPQSSYYFSEFISVDPNAVSIPSLFESNFESNYNKILKKNQYEIDASVVPSIKVAAFSPQSDILLAQGTILNDLLLHKEAIPFLTEAIQYNPSNRDAYIERAMAYFEIDQLPLALIDYEQAKKLTLVVPLKLGFHQATGKMKSVYLPEDKTEFVEGLVIGTVEGAKVSAAEFIPSIFSCCRGILNGLWALVCSPIEVSHEMVYTAYAMGGFISNHSAEECFQHVVPELKDLSISWDELSDYLRGKKIGYIIGKYGVDIFALSAALKGVNTVRALKRANTMCTLESCAISEIKQKRILEESAKRVSMRETLIIDSGKKGKILIKSSNVQFHVMQPKHAWDKVLKHSGNIEEDFKKVSLLLEEHSILSEKFLLESEKFSHGKIIRADYKKIINGNEVRAAFETYVESNQTFLKDAWVITK